MSRLIGPRAKIERANEHIGDLKTAIERFHETNPYAVVKEKDAEAGQLVYRFKMRTEPPTRLALIVGDAIHNLRSALDLLFCQMVEANNKTISRRDSFPISDSGNEFETRFRQIKGRIPSPTRQVLRSLKPYKGGNDGLWRLHQLDVIDKHRLLLAVWAGNEAVVLRFRLQPPGEDEAIVFPPIGIRPNAEGRRLKHDSDLYRFALGKEMSEMHEEPQFTIGIALDEPPVVECESVLPTLTDLSGTVAETVDLFAPLLL